MRAGVANRFTPLGARELKAGAAALKDLAERMQGAGILEDLPERKLMTSLRLFPAQEACANLDLKPRTLFAWLRKDQTLPQGDHDGSASRAFSIEEIHTLRRAMGLAPRRPPGSLPLTIAVCNLVKGGGKTVTTVNLRARAG
jgi:hypothetical protein